MFVVKYIHIKIDGKGYGCINNDMEFRVTKCINISHGLPDPSVSIRFRF